MGGGGGVVTVTAAGEEGKVEATEMFKATLQCNWRKLEPDACSMEEDMLLSPRTLRRNSSQNPRLEVFICR